MLYGIGIPCIVMLEETQGAEQLVQHPETTSNSKCIGVRLHIDIGSQLSRENSRFPQVPSAYQHTAFPTKPLARKAVFGFAKILSRI